MATTTRADQYTQTSKQVELFSDFLDSFAASPLNGTLARVTNDKAIKQAVKNLVLTNLGERLYQPDVGTDTRRSLFEQNDIITAMNLQARIENVIQNYEPRVKRVQVFVEPSVDQHSMLINIIFYISNTTEQQSVTIKLRRIR